MTPGKFRSQFDSHTRLYTEPGSPVKVVYNPHYNAFGELIIEPSGEEDLYGYIQSHKDSCDIHKMLERFAAGDEDALSQAQGFYADVSGMPQTYAEVLNAVLAGEATFNQLPAEVKAQFDNSFAVWLSAMDRPDFAQRMGFSESPVPTDVSDSVLQPPAPAPAPASPAPAPASPAPAPSGSASQAPAAPASPPASQ